MNSSTSQPTSRPTFQPTSQPTSHLPSFVLEEFLKDAKEFGALYLSKVRSSQIAFNPAFVFHMVQDEMKELEDAKDEAERVDAVLDATYYILDHLGKFAFEETVQVLRVSRTGKAQMECNNLESFAWFVEESIRSQSKWNTDTEWSDSVKLLVDLAEKFVGGLYELGVDPVPVWKLIHQANMTKFGPGGYCREDGKWVKPPNFTPPDDLIRKEIARQRSGQAIDH